MPADNTLLYRQTATVRGMLIMNPLKSAWGTIISGVVIAAAIAYSTDVAGMDSARFVILIHVAVGITWVGLLYYFNFVQVQALAEAAGDEGGPGGAGITKYVAPRALLWFRWAALATWLSGAIYLLEKGNFGSAFMLGMGGNGDPTYGLTIGIGAWLGTIMLFNVWILIWPNQKKILGMVEATPEQIGSAKFVALMASRTNTMLSIPMLMSMVGAHHGFFM
jgi:uncharacterized membrane protein